MCDACFHRVKAAINTITADDFAASKALEYIIIIVIIIIVIIFLIRGGDVEPPNPPIRGLDSIAAQHGVRDHLPAVSTCYCTGNNVDAFNQEMASLLSGNRCIFDGGLRERVLRKVSSVPQSMYRRYTIVSHISRSPVICLLQA